MPITRVSDTAAIVTDTGSRKKVCHRKIDDMLTKMTFQFVLSQEPSVLVKFSGTVTDRYGRCNIADAIRTANGFVHFHTNYPLDFDHDLTNIHQQQLVDSYQNNLLHARNFEDLYDNEDEDEYRDNYQDEYPDDMRCYG
jgi:hypothetical protein